MRARIHSVVPLMPAIALTIGFALLAPREARASLLSEESEDKLATFIALFAAQGFEVVPVPAGETRAPERDVPFAVLSSLAVASVLYIIVQTALVGSRAGLAQASDAPLADAALAIAPALGVVIAVGGLISTLGFVSGSALGTPRYLYAVAREGPPDALAPLLDQRRETALEARIPRIDVDLLACLGILQEQRADGGDLFLSGIGEPDGEHLVALSQS